MLLFQVANKHLSSRRKFGTVTHQTNTLQFSLDGVTQLSGDILRLHYNIFTRKQKISARKHS
ncbi:hypothetical protein A3N65_12470 [Klebsiella aerogenes]|nr:hypothetical protein A3N65_12470 [Klebsiella aerogenes]